MHLKYMWFFIRSQFRILNLSIYIASKLKTHIHHIFPNHSKHIKNTFVIHKIDAEEDGRSVFYVITGLFGQSLESNSIKHLDL